MATEYIGLYSVFNNSSCLRKLRLMKELPVDQSYRMSQVFHVLFHTIYRYRQEEQCI